VLVIQAPLLKREARKNKGLYIMWLQFQQNEGSLLVLYFLLTPFLFSNKSSRE